MSQDSVLITVQPLPTQSHRRSVVDRPRPLPSLSPLSFTHSLHPSFSASTSLCVTEPFCSHQCGSSPSLIGAILTHREFSPCLLVPVLSPSPFLPSPSTLSVKASRGLKSQPLSLLASPGLSRGLQASESSHRLQALAHRH
ncbi:hypothetical protein PIB30_072337, partial [Stylosanthes scabra]|nr:hypothetical protein [Stylosanthes scabra]